MTGAAHPRGDLPPGQRRIDFFPRFGRRSDQPAPTVREFPTVVFGGALTAPIEMTVDELVSADRRELHADLHCVAGWSVTGLHWEGVAFADVQQRFVATAVVLSTIATHVRVRGLDGDDFVAELADLLADDVLLTDRLGGRPLDGDDGAPLRLVNPAQYGYANSMCAESTCWPTRRRQAHRRGSTGCCSPTLGRGSGRRSAMARCPVG